MCELIQRGIKSDPFFGFLIGGAIGLARDCRGDVPAAAGGNAIVRVVDQELAHGAAGQRKKVFATADGRSTLLGNAQLELVHD